MLALTRKLGTAARAANGNSRNLQRATSRCMCNAVLQMRGMTKSVMQESGRFGVSASQFSRSFATASPGGPAIDGQYLNMSINENGVAIIKLDNKTEKVNTLSSGAMGEFEQLLNKLESDSSIKSAVILSAKPDNWVAGADIKMLDAAKSEEELSQLAGHGQQLMDRLERVWKVNKKPVVAAIHGSCLGGGLELALASQYRIASSHSKTKLGVPEVMLGLLPGAGGTQRLPKVVGIQEALTMATTGKNIKPDKAKKMGLVHAVADPHALEHAALQAAEGLANGSFKMPSKKQNFMAKVLEGNTVGRTVLFNQAKGMIEKKAGSHYPAPVAIWESIKTGVEQGHEAGSKKERELFGKLGMTSESEALRGIFFSQNATKKNPFGKPKHDTNTVAVLGAGLMGAGIAQVSAVDAGCRVILKDKFNAGLNRGEAQIRKNLDQKVKRRSMTPFERDRAMSRVVGLADDQSSWGAFGATPAADSSDFDETTKRHLSQTDLVVEAVFEDINVKHKVIKEIEPMLPEHAVFATNTSAIPIEDVSKAATRPQNVLGMHYFSPVDKMPLLEIIPHTGTDNEVAARAVQHGYKQGKTVIVVKDVPGFYVNRCLGPFMTEAVSLLQEGVAPETLDKSMKKFGFPVGPVTLCDEVGIDVAQHVQEFLSDKLENRMGGADVGVLQEFVKQGFLGRKAGKGFFTYQKGKKGKELNPEATSILKNFVKSDSAGQQMDEATIQERMSSRFLIEAIMCLQNGIIRNAADGDIGAVFGIGFPPFRGGPFRWIDQVGAPQILDTMQKHADSVGDHFSPPELLRDVAKKNGKFHDLFGAPEDAKM